MEKGEFELAQILLSFYLELVMLQSLSFFRECYFQFSRVSRILNISKIIRYFCEWSGNN